MIKVDLVKGQWKKLDKLEGTIQLVSTSQESEMLVKTSETGEAPTDDIGFKVGSWQGHKAFNGNGKSVYVKLIKGEGYALVDNISLGSYARIKIILQEIAVQKQNLTIKVNSQTKLSLPPNDKFKGQYWRAEDMGIVSVNAYTGDMIAVKKGNTIVKGYYGTPYYQLGVEYNVTVTPEPPKVIEEKYTRNVGETVQLNDPTPNEDWNTPIFELADKSTQVITVTPQGLVVAQAQGQAIVNCYFTKPSKVLAKKTTIIVNPAPTPPPQV